MNHTGDNKLNLSNLNQNAYNTLTKNQAKQLGKLQGKYAKVLNSNDGTDATKNANKINKSALVLIHSIANKTEAKKLAMAFQDANDLVFATNTNPSKAKGPAELKRYVQEIKLTQAGGKKEELSQLRKFREETKVAGTKSTQIAEQVHTVVGHTVTRLLAAKGLEINTAKPQKVEHKEQPKQTQPNATGNNQLSMANVRSEKVAAWLETIKDNGTHEPGIEAFWNENEEGTKLDEIGAYFDTVLKEIARMENGHSPRILPFATGVSTSDTTHRASGIFRDLDENSAEWLATSLRRDLPEQYRTDDVLSYIKNSISEMQQTGIHAQAKQIASEIITDLNLPDNTQTQGYVSQMVATLLDPNFKQQTHPPAFTGEKLALPRGETVFSVHQQVMDSLQERLELGGDSASRIDVKKRQYVRACVDTLFGQTPVEQYKELSTRATQIVEDLMKNSFTQSTRNNMPPEAKYYFTQIVHEILLHVDYGKPLELPGYSEEKAEIALQRSYTDTIRSLVTWSGVESDTVKLLMNELVQKGVTGKKVGVQTRPLVTDTTHKNIETQILRCIEQMTGKDNTGRIARKDTRSELVKELYDAIEPYIEGGIPAEAQTSLRNFLHNVLIQQAHAAIGLTPRPVIWDRDTKFTIRNQTEVSALGYIPQQEDLETAVNEVLGSILGSSAGAKESIAYTTRCLETLLATKDIGVAQRLVSKVDTIILSDVNSEVTRLITTAYTNVDLILRVSDASDPDKSLTQKVVEGPIADVLQREVTQILAKRKQKPTTHTQSQQPTFQADSLPRDCDEAADRILRLAFPAGASGVPSPEFAAIKSHPLLSKVLQSVADSEGEAIWQVVNNAVQNSTPIIGKVAGKVGTQLIMRKLATELPELLEKLSAMGVDLESAMTSAQKTYENSGSFETTWQVFIYQIAHSILSNQLYSQLSNLDTDYGRMQLLAETITPALKSAAEKNITPRSKIEQQPNLSEYEDTDSESVDSITTESSSESSKEVSEVEQSYAQIGTSVLKILSPRMAGILQAASKTSKPLFMISKLLDDIQKKEAQYSSTDPFVIFIGQAVVNSLNTTEANKLLELALNKAETVLDAKSNQFAPVGSKRLAEPTTPTFSSAPKTKEAYKKEYEDAIEAVRIILVDYIDSRGISAKIGRTTLSALILQDPELKETMNRFAKELVNIFSELASSENALEILNGTLALINP